MSSNTATGALASNVASDGAAALRRKAAEKCQLVLSTLRDSYDGYKQCVADTKDAAMRLLFDKIAESRADFISQLSNSIRVDLGVEPYVILILFSYKTNLFFFRVQSGSTLASAHRTWIDVKAWFTDGRDKSAIVTEVHRGEEALITLYQSAIDDPNIIPKVRDLLHEQLQTIKAQNASVDAL
jgi:hypothetical protein